MPKRTIVASALVVCGFLCAWSGESAMERQTTPALQGWKNSKLVTIEIKNMAFSKAIEMFETKTGVKFDGHAKESNISLKLQASPFWKAVADLSTASRSSFFTEPEITNFGGEEPRVFFNPKYPACDYYQIIGPFHIGLYHRGTKEGPLVLIQSSSLNTEGQNLGRGIRKVLLKCGGETIRLQQKVMSSDSPKSKCHWEVPSRFINKGADLAGEMECEVYSNPQTITVPVKLRGASDFNVLDGVRVTTEVSKHEKMTEIKFSIHWDTGVDPRDAKKLTDSIERAKKGLLKPDEEEAAFDWAIAKSEKG